MAKANLGTGGGEEKDLEHAIHNVPMSQTDWLQLPLGYFLVCPRFGTWEYFCSPNQNRSPKILFFPKEILCIFYVSIEKPIFSKESEFWRVIVG